MSRIVSQHDLYPDQVTSLFFARVMLPGMTQAFSGSGQIGSSVRTRSLTYGLVARANLCLE